MGVAFQQANSWLAIRVSIEKLTQTNSDQSLLTKNCDWIDLISLGLEVSHWIGWIGFFTNQIVAEHRLFSKDAIIVVTSPIVCPLNIMFNLFHTSPDCRFEKGKEARVRLTRKSRIRWSLCVQEMQRDIGGSNTSAVSAFYKKIGKQAEAPVPLIKQLRGESTKKGTQWCVDSIWKRGLWSGRPNIAAGAESHGPVAWISLSESKQRDAGFATSMNWQEVKANVKEEENRWGGGQYYLCAHTFCQESRQSALYEG